MIEKVNPSHPDKVADRIAGALVDLAYKEQENPKIAVEVLIGHGYCMIISETSVRLGTIAAEEVVDRIIGDDSIITDYLEVSQDTHLAENQSKEIRCGDNGIFKGVPINKEERRLSDFVRRLYEDFPTDGKFIYDESGEVPQIIMCQSNADNAILEQMAISCLEHDGNSGKIAITVNPLGEWTGGTNVDTGATNRKLGSDMGRAVTGGGLHGKDLSKADVAVNIACHLMAQETGLGIEALCAIGDSAVEFRREDGEKARITYDEVVQMAAEFIAELGGFEKLAEWGLF